MPSLKALRKRIASVSSTQQITKAMKMVAAAKLRRAQEAAERARPYAGKLAEMFAAVVAGRRAEAPIRCSRAARSSASTWSCSPATAASAAASTPT